MPKDSPQQADFERQQKINQAYADYQAGKITGAECVRRVKKAEKK